MKTHFYKLFIGVWILLYTSVLQAQLSGIVTVPGTYTSIASIITDLNSVGISGALTVNIAAGYNETAPVGGYVLNAVTGVSSGNQIIFRKNGVGANPLITAYVGTATPISAIQDGVWRFIGSDYITIDGIDINDPNSINPATMEFGYGFFKASGSNGCQNNSIKNCTITLNRINNVVGAGTAADGSRAIDVVNATTSAHTTSLIVTAPAGSNSYNKFYGNTLQNCNVGISIIGFEDSPPYLFSDSGNEAGGIVGNNILNFGGANANATACGIQTSGQMDLSVIKNTIHNNTGLALDHPGVLRGIRVNILTGGTTSINDNTVTTRCSASGYNVGIETTGVTGIRTTTININNNLIFNCVSSATFTGISNTANIDELNINMNTLASNSVSTQFPVFTNVFSRGAVTRFLKIDNNTIDMGSFTATNASPYLYGIENFNNSILTTTTSISSNTFQNASFAGTGAVSGYGYCIDNSTSVPGATISNNNFKNLSINSVNLTLINTRTAGSMNISGNQVTTGLNKTAGGGAFYGCYINQGITAGTATVSDNNFSNITTPGTTDIIGIYFSAPSSYTSNISRNILSNITGGGITLIKASFHLNAITENTISAISGGGQLTGIYEGFPGMGYQISNNVIKALSSSGSTLVAGISLDNPNLASNFRIFKNKVYDLSASGSGGKVYGLYMVAGTAIDIYNNLIGDLKAPAASSDNAISGIRIDGGSANLYYNTIYLNASSSGTVFGSSALYAYTLSGLLLKNNIFINNSTPSGTAVTAAYQRFNAGVSAYSLTSNNNLFYAGLPSPNHLIYYAGTNSAQTLGAFQTLVTPREANSITENTPFLSTSGASPNFLHIDVVTGSLVESGGVNMAGITDDFDGDTRQGNGGYSGTGSAPDIGADEINQPLCTLANAGTVTVSSYSICASQSVVMISTGLTPNQGAMHQWKVSSTAGGPYSNVTGGAGAISSAYSTPALNPGNLYYVLTTTCSNTSNTSVSNEVTVSVGAYPTLTIAANASTLCTGQNMSLTAGSNIGTTYTWSGPGSFTSTSQNPVLNVSSGNAGTYTAMVSTPIGCTQTANIIISLISPPSLFINASQTTLCLGSSVSLQANGAATYTWNTQNTSQGIVVSPSVSTVYSVSTQLFPCPVVTNTINIVVFPSPTISVASTPSTLCVGNNATLTITGAFTYSLNNTLTSSTTTIAVTSATNYLLSGTDLFGCHSSATISSYALPLTSVSSSSIVVCKNFSATLSASGASTYSWSNGFSGALNSVTPLITQVYTVTGQNLHCSSNATVLVTVNQNPTVTISPSATLVCKEDKATTLNAGGALTYTWVSASNNPTVNPTISVAPAITANYSVSGTDLNGCTNTTFVQIIVEDCTSLADLKENLIKIYPNPSAGEFVISFDSPLELVIFNDLGQYLKTIVLNNNGDHKVIISDLPSGIYFVKGVNNGTRFIQKLVISR